VHSLGPQHWTLLIVKTEGAEHVVQYYDSLEPGHPRCRANANILLQLMGVKAQVNLVRNAVRQTHDECGWFVCHYVEEVLRTAAGHPLQSQKWPFPNRLATLKSWLKRIVDSLEGERQKLCSEVVSEQKKQAALEAKMQKLAKQFLEHKGLLQRAAEVHAALAFELHNAGAGLEPPSLDADFVAAVELHKQEMLRKRLERLHPPLVLPPVEESLHAAQEPAPPVEDPLQAEEVQQVLQELAPPVEVPQQVVEELVPPLAEGVMDKLRAEFENNKDFVELALQVTRMDDLSAPQREHMERVIANGKGVCSRCRWKSGCLSCDREKAWAYCVKVELGLKGAAKAAPASG
jgi:hypothetical protein